MPQFLSRALEWFRARDSAVKAGVVTGRISRGAGPPRASHGRSSAAVKPGCPPSCSYSPQECVEGEFCELRACGFLGSWSLGTLGR